MLWRPSIRTFATVPCSMSLSKRPPSMLPWSRKAIATVIFPNIRNMAQFSDSTSPLAATSCTALIKQRRGHLRSHHIGLSFVHEPFSGFARYTRTVRTSHPFASFASPGPGLSCRPLLQKPGQAVQVSAVLLQDPYGTKSRADDVA